MKRVLSPRPLTLSAVAGLLFLVSVPRVHQLAVHDNQRDAMSAVLLLVPPVFNDADLGATPPSNESLSQELGHRLNDVRYDPRSRLIRRHGYFLDVGLTHDRHGIIRAWPERHGRTGVSAFVYDRSRGLLSNPNASAAWSGAGSIRPDGTEAGWQPVSPRR